MGSINDQASKRLLIKKLKLRNEGEIPVERFAKQLSLHKVRYIFLTTNSLSLTSISGLTLAGVTGNSVYTASVGHRTGNAGTIVYIHLTVHTCK